MGNPNILKTQMFPGNVLINGDLTVRGRFNQNNQQSIVNQGSSFQPSGSVNPLAFFDNLEYYRGLGEIWYTKTHGFLSAVTAIATNGAGVIVAGDSGGIICRSTDDGLTWSGAITNPFGGSTMSAMVYAAGVIVAASNGGKIARSLDLGLTWGSLITNPVGVGDEIFTLAYGGGVIIGVSFFGSQVLISKDLGATWSTVSNPFGGVSLVNVAFLNGVFVIGDNNGNVSRSLDYGATWGNLIPTGLTTFNGLAGGNGILIAGGGIAGIVARSADLGLTWSLIQSPLGGNIAVTTYGLGYFLIFSSTGEISTSGDGGKTWSVDRGNSLPTLSAPNCAVYGVSHVILGGSVKLVAVSSWQRCDGFVPDTGYIPVFTGFGTVSAVNFFWSKVGNRIKVMGKFTVGTPTAVEARISLPNSFVSDDSLVTSITVCGTEIDSAASSTLFARYPLIESGVGHITMGQRTSGASPFAKIVGTAFSAATVIGLQFELPVKGWAA